MNMQEPILLPTEVEKKKKFPFSLLTEKRKNTFLEHRYLLLCMLIPAVLIYLIYLARGEHPFGDGCVLVLDLNGQYVWFFEALRNFVHGDADLLYSFSRALGGEFLGIYAYYLASPLSYLVCLFPKERMLEALLTLFMLKGALCGFTFGYYMHKTEKLRTKLSVILFSTCYALCSYAVVQQHNTMWIDAVMWLPLITLGIESVIKHGKFKLYTIFLALTLFSNYYIGYMVCIYCLIYFFVYYFAHNENNENNPFGEKFHFWRSLLRMALYSAIAIGIAAIIIFAAYYSLNFGKTTFTNPKWEILLKFDLLDFFYKLLPGSYDTVRPEGLPFLYCGVLTLLLIPAYFLSERYSMRQKIFSGVLIFVLFASSVINVVDLVWHGFQNPNWLNGRYSFMLSFYLCVLACRAFSDFEKISLRAMMATGGIIGVLCVMLQQYTKGEYINPDDFTCIYFSLILVFAYLAILAVLRKTVTPQVVSVTLVALVCAELFLNGLFNINALGEDVGYSRYSYYNNFLNKTRPIVEMVQKKDSSFYRMEKTFFRKTNDNMALSMRGLSGSTSTLNKETIKFLNKMGYSSKSHWSKYLGGTPVNDSLLGLKYIISDNPIYGLYYETFATDEVNGYTAYYNPYALSLAYGVDMDALDFVLGFTDETPSNGTEENESPSVIDAIKQQINNWLGIEEIQGKDYADDYYSPFERLNGMVTAMLGEDEPVQIFVSEAEHDVEEIGVIRGYYVGGEHGYKKMIEDDDGYVIYTVEASTDGEMFFYLPTNYPREVKLSLSVNGGKEEDWGTFHGNETSRIISLGMREEGDRIALKMTLTKKDFYILSNQNCFYHIDREVFEDAMARLGAYQYQITDYTEHSFEGTITAKEAEQLVLTTIPYDAGWEIYVDGERVELQKAFGALISFQIDGKAEQTHTVQMIYRPKAISVGIVISILSLLLFIGLMVLNHYRPLGCRPTKKKDTDAIEEKIEQTTNNTPLPNDLQETASEAHLPKQSEETIDGDNTIRRTHFQIRFHPKAPKDSDTDRKD